MGVEGKELQHFGVKGMRWGTRKTESRADYKARVTKEKNSFYEKKAESITTSAAKGGDKVLIKTRFGGDQYQTITTGKEFVNELSRGRAFDIRTTEVFASQKKAGEAFVLNNEQFGAYKKSKRR